MKKMIQYHYLCNGCKGPNPDMNPCILEFIGHEDAEDCIGPDACPFNFDNLVQWREINRISITIDSGAL